MICLCEIMQGYGFNGDGTFLSLFHLSAAYVAALLYSQAIHTPDGSSERWVSQQRNTFETLKPGSSADDRMRGEHDSMDLHSARCVHRSLTSQEVKAVCGRGCNGCLVEVYMAHQSGCHSSSKKIPKLAGKSPEIDAFLRRAIYC